MSLRPLHVRPQLSRKIFLAADSLGQKYEGLLACTFPVTPDPWHISGTTALTQEQPPQVNI